MQFEGFAHLLSLCMPPSHLPGVAILYHTRDVASSDESKSQLCLPIIKVPASQGYSLSNGLHPGHLLRFVTPARTRDDAGDSAAHGAYVDLWPHINGAFCCHTYVELRPLLSFNPLQCF